MSKLPLPVVDLSPFSLPHVDHASINMLAAELGKALETEGFAYLVNVPLTFSHDQVFALAKGFFRIPQAEKLRLAKRTFERNNKNTYRG